MNKYELYDITTNKGFIYFDSKDKAKEFKKIHKDLIYLAPISYSFATYKWGLCVIYNDQVKLLGYDYECR